MSEHLNSLLSTLPFLLLSAEGKVQVNKTRIVETVIIAILGGLVAGYVGFKQMEVKFNILERKVDKIYEDIYRPVIGR